MNVINELDEGVCAEDVAFNNRIHKSLVSKWKCVRKEIIDGAASKQLKLLKKGRKTKKHNAMFEKLIIKFREARTCSCKQDPKRNESGHLVLRFNLYGNTKFYFDGSNAKNRNLKHRILPNS